MSTEIKPCPFCGLDGESMAWRENGGIDLIEHPNTDCILADFRTDDVEQWNQRATVKRVSHDDEAFETYWNYHHSNKTGHFKTFAREFYRLRKSHDDMAESLLLTKQPEQT